MCVDKKNSCVVFEETCSSTDGTNTIIELKKSKMTSYSIRKVLKSLFKKQKVAVVAQQIQVAHFSMESLDNYRNCQVEDHYEEIEENTANEKLLSYIYTYDDVIEDCQSPNYANHHHHHQHSFRQTDATKWDVKCNDQPEIYVPVRFARTEAGTFFWTTNLKPVDDDLIHPVYCHTGNQIPQLQFQDRWAQA